MARSKVLIAKMRQSLSREAPSRFKVEEVSQMSGLIDAMINRIPNVVVLPIDFPGLGGIPGVRNVRRLSPATKIVVLTQAVNSNEELEVLRRGAKGYSGPVPTEQLFKMVDKVQEGEVWAGRKTIGALLDEYQSANDSETRAHPVTARDLERLTSRERQIVRLLSDGMSNKEIASALSVSVSTIKAHLTKIFRKLGQSDRVRLALAAIGSISAGEPTTQES